MITGEQGKECALASEKMLAADSSWETPGESSAAQAKLLAMQHYISFGSFLPPHPDSNYVLQS